MAVMCMSVWTREALGRDVRRGGRGLLLRVARSAIAAATLGAVTLGAAPLHAQSNGVRLSARGGFAAVDDAYQSNCGHSSLAFGVDVQGGGRLFPMASLDRFWGSGGGDVLCLPVAPSIGNAAGGLRLEGATRFGLGAGARAGSGAVQLEGALLGGVIAGRPGFDGRDRDGARRMLPQVGGQASLVLFRHIVLSATTSWTRLSLEVTPTGGGAVETRRSWSPMTTLQAGVRVGGG